MSSYQPQQLGLFGEVIAFEAVPAPEPQPPAPVAPPPRREVSAEREGRAAQRTLEIALDPPDIEGWREELGHPRPQIVNGVCVTGEKWRRRVDGTLGPCPFFGCVRHLAIDSGPPVTIGGRRRAELILNRAGLDPAMGRRPALPAVPTDGESDEFALHAIARAEELPDTCADDVLHRLKTNSIPMDVDVQMGGVETEDEDDRAAAMAAQEAQFRRDAEAMQVQEIARALGVSVEQVRLDTLSGAAKLGIRMVNGQPRASDGARVEAMLAKIDGRRAVPTDDEIEDRSIRVLSFMGWRSRRGAVASADVARALLTDTSPPPVVIRRIDREAPPPREASAAEIFTF